jgi:DNA gyrase subunit A
VFKGKVGEFSEEDLIPNEPTVITLTQTGYIKRQSLNSFTTQNRGGKGVTGMKMKDEDMIAHIRSAMTHDNILFFSNKGKVYQLRAYEIVESSRVSKGAAIINLLNIEAGEKIESFVIYKPDLKSGYVFLTTRKGTVKKTALKEFANIRKSGMIAIKLEKGDELVWSNFTTGDNEILIITKQGKAIKFKEESVRSTGRDTMGVRGIKQLEGDEVIGMDVITKGDNPNLLTLMHNGLGKKTEVRQFPLQSRGGQGVKVAKVTEKTGEVAVAQVIPPTGEEVIMTSSKGQVVKLSLNQIPKLSRDTQGVILMRFSDKSDKIVSATCIEKTPSTSIPETVN